MKVNFMEVDEEILEEKVVEVVVEVIEVNNQK